MQSVFNEKMFVHLFFNTMQVLGTDNKAVERCAHVLFKEDLHWTWYYFLVRVAHSSQTETFCLAGVGSGLFVTLDFQQLLNTFLNSHESWRFVYFSVLENILLGSFFDFDIN